MRLGTEWEHWNDVLVLVEGLVGEMEKGPRGKAAAIGT